jgi:hypothetical protein
MEGDFISEEHRLYFQEAKLGISAESFFRSELGQYILGRAKGEMDDAKAEAMNIRWWSPFAARKLKKLQNKHRQAELSIQWLSQAIDNGEAAIQALEEFEAN